MRGAAALTRFDVCFYFARDNENVKEAGRFGEKQCCPDYSKFCLNLLFFFYFLNEILKKSKKELNKKYVKSLRGRP